MTGGNTTVDTADQVSQENLETNAQVIPQVTPAPFGDAEPVRVESDLDFIRAIHPRGGDTFKKCFQCGTCSASCTISPDANPFPRKEMAWAVWGMKDSLLADPDVWLCYQCSDCSTRCPRGARPGDVLAAVRRECIRHYAFPRFLGKWVSQPRYIPFLLGLPAVLLGLALLVRSPIEKALDISAGIGEEIVYSYSASFPHWLLNSFFMFFSVLVFLSIITGVVRFWRAMKSATSPDKNLKPSKPLGSSIVAALKVIFTHDNFAGCDSAHSRYLSHLCVFFGFIALSIVTLWVITSGFNPLIKSEFVYPFGFLSPWKILANLGGAFLVLGCILMILDRLEDDKPTGGSTYFDWSFLLILLVVTVSGFATELLHYLRLEPHRHIVYFIHLVLVFVLLINLPFSKFAHVVYRTTAMVFAEHTGRNDAGEGNKVTVSG
jgi:quinone-modifying oxidoreductase subunit QmoC